MPIGPFDCDDLGIVGGLAGLGLTLARVLGGVALVFSSVALVPDR